MASFFVGAFFVGVRAAWRQQIAANREPSIATTIISSQAVANVTMNKNLNIKCSWFRIALPWLMTSCVNQQLVSVFLDNSNCSSGPNVAFIVALVEHVNRPSSNEIDGWQRNGAADKTSKYTRAYTYPEMKRHACVCFKWIKVKYGTWTAEQDPLWLEKMPMTRRTSTTMKIMTTTAAQLQRSQHVGVKKSREMFLCFVCSPAPAFCSVSDLAAISDQPKKKNCTSNKKVSLHRWQKRKFMRKWNSPQMSKLDLRAR